MLFVSEQQIFEFLEIENGSHSSLLKNLQEGITKRFETYMGREFEKKERTEKFDGGTPYFQLKAFPIDTGETITVTEDGITLVENDDYYVRAEEGVIEFGREASETYPLNIVITYTGGYTIASEVIAVPDDLKRACVYQTAFEFRRRKDLGASAVNMGDGSMSISKPTELLKDVKLTLDSYRLIRS